MAEMVESLLDNFPFLGADMINLVSACRRA